MNESFSHMDHLFAISWSICCCVLISFHCAGFITPPPLSFHSPAVMPPGITVLLWLHVMVGLGLFSLKPEALGVRRSWPFPPSKEVPRVSLSPVVSSSRPRV